jgi:hypothetical protein
MKHPKNVRGVVVRYVYLSEKLSYPLPIDGGEILHTIRDARKFMLALGRQRSRLHEHWHQVYDLMMAEADVNTVTQQFQHALLQDGLLDLNEFKHWYGPRAIIT